MEDCRKNSAFQRNCVLFCLLRKTTSFMEMVQSSVLVRALLEMANQADLFFFVFAPESRQFLYLNPAVYRHFEKIDHSFLTNPHLLLSPIHPEDVNLVKYTYQELLRGTPMKDIEFRMLLSEQAENWLQLTAFLINTQSVGQALLVGYGKDITITREHFENLKKFAAKKNSILEILSHDLAGPLAIIDSLTSILAKQTKIYQDAELDKTIELIGEISKRNVQLIRDFVKTEFLESSEVALVKQRIDLVEQIKESFEEYKRSEENIAKTFELQSSQEKIFVRIDDVKFMQVLNNLISNSIKFTPDGGNVRIELEDQAENLLIKVIDNGIGIPKHLQEGLFDKFTKARRPGLKGEPSVGLGMSIIKTIIEWHKGEIWFESEENKGTTFYILIPKD